MAIPVRPVPAVLIVLVIATAAPTVLAVDQEVRSCLETQSHLIGGACTGSGSPTVAGWYQVRVDRASETCSTTCSDSSQSCSGDSECRQFDRIEIPYDQTKGSMTVVIVTGDGWTAAAQPLNNLWVLSGPSVAFLEYSIQVTGSVSRVGPSIQDSGNELAISGDDDVPSILEPTPAVSIVGLAVLVAVLLVTGLWLIGRRQRGGSAPA